MSERSDVSGTPRTDALKPCPFCGGTVEMHYTGSSDWEVVCGDCPVETRFWVSAKKHGYGEGESAEARRRWNTRTIESALAEVLKKANDVEDDKLRAIGLYDSCAEERKALQVALAAANERIKYYESERENLMLSTENSIDAREKAEAEAAAMREDARKYGAALVSLMSALKHPRPPTKSEWAQINQLVILIELAANHTGESKSGREG